MPEKGETRRGRRRVSSDYGFELEAPWSRKPAGVPDSDVTIRADYSQLPSA